MSTFLLLAPVYNIMFVVHDRKKQKIRKHLLEQYREYHGNLCMFAQPVVTKLALCSNDTTAKERLNERLSA